METEHRAPSFELRYMSTQYVSGFWFDNDAAGTSRTRHGDVWTNAFRRHVAEPYTPHGEIILSNETMSRSEVTFLPVPSPQRVYAERYKLGRGTHNMALWVDYDLKAGHECFLLRHGDHRYWLLRLPASHPMKCGSTGHAQKFKNFGTPEAKAIVNVTSVDTVCPDLLPHLVEARNRELTFIHPIRWAL